MKCMLLVIADYAGIEQATGKLNIIGAFGRIFTSQDFPFIYRRMSLAVKVESELGDHHEVRTLKVKVVDEDEGEHFFISAPFRFKQSNNGMPSEFNAVLELNELKFPHPGTYTFVVYVDDEEIERTHLQIIQRQKAG